MWVSGVVVSGKMLQLLQVLTSWSDLWNQVGPLSGYSWMPASTPQFCSIFAAISLPKDLDTGSFSVSQTKYFYWEVMSGLPGNLLPECTIHCHVPLTCCTHRRVGSCKLNPLLLATKYSWVSGWILSGLSMVFLKMRVWYLGSLEWHLKSFQNMD